jgi:CheY-like chemotaxis protein
MQGNVSPGRISLGGIAGLNLAAKISKMTDAQYDSYLKELNTFIDYFPAQARKMRESLHHKKFSDLNKQMFSICNILEKIHANELANEFRKTINGFRPEENERLAAFTEKFILDVSSLSLEIQTAAHKSRQKATASATATPRPVKKFARASILAVDNAVMFLNSLERYLSDAPYDLHCVTSGREALKYLDSNKPDLILLDIEMPEMDGFEVARKIKMRDVRAPIIFVTANSEREDVDMAFKVGAVDILIKPFRVNQLLEKLKQYT